MNTDPLEKMLRAQTPRQIPFGWRSEILAAAREARTQSEPPPAAFPAARLALHFSRLKDWLWPSPRAWAGLAAVWLVILGVNLAERHPSLPSGGSAAPGWQSGSSFKARERLLGELFLWAESGALEHPKASAARPANERRAPGGTSRNGPAIHNWV